MKLINKINLNKTTSLNIDLLKLYENIIVYNFNYISNSQSRSLINKEHNDYTGKFTFSKVKNIWAKRYNYYYLINNNLKITGFHIIFIKRNNKYMWTFVNNLNLNDYIFHINNYFEKIDNIIKISKSIIEYNLEVNDYHNFFLNNYLIHNAESECEACSFECGGPEEGEGEREEEERPPPLL